MGATTAFSANQQVFIGVLANKTGLDKGVVAAWVAAEQPVGADKTVGRGDQNWLNIGITDSKSYGVGNNVWSDPALAATATADWMKGKKSVSGYGRASSGIQRIIRTASSSPIIQLNAIRQSGWASSGYPNLASIYDKYKKFGTPDGEDDTGNWTKHLATPAEIVASPVTGALKGIDLLADAVSNIGHLFAQLFSSATWLRIGKVYMGVLIATIALWKLSGISASDVAGVATKNPAAAVATKAAAATKG